MQNTLRKNRKQSATQTHLDWPVHVGLFNAQNNLPGDGNSIEEVVDEAHVVNESVHITGAQHKQRGQALRNGKGAVRGRKWDVCCF